MKPSSHRDILGEPCQVVAAPINPVPRPLGQRTAGLFGDGVRALVTPLPVPAQSAGGAAFAAEGPGGGTGALRLSAAARAAASEGLGREPLALLICATATTPQAG